MRLGLRGVLAATGMAFLLQFVPGAAGQLASPPRSLAPLSLSPPVSQPTVSAPTLPSQTLADAYSPLRLAIVDEPESVYPQIIPPESQEPVNAGAVNFDLTVSYLSRYVFRGVDQATLPGHTEDSLQFNGAAEFDLGKIPHPFIGLFVNVFNNDPVARFEEVRPVVGLRWLLKPLTLIGTYTSYIFPNRKALDTQEVSLELSLDDSRLWNTVNPVLSPYIYSAYDFGIYYGVYFEVGIKHDFVIEETGLTLTPSASMAYVLRDPYFRKAVGGSDTGAQHFEVGMTLTYSLNNLLNIPRRFGHWNVRGYLFDDGPIDSDLRANTRLFGGAGINFEY
jgi:hypothetical protein